MKRKDITKVLICVVITLMVVITLTQSFKTIKSGEVGLKVRFGKIVNSKLNEGLNLKVPFIEKIVSVNIKVQKNELNVEGSTKDMQIVNTTVAVNYRVDGTKADSLYKEVGNEYEEVILDPAIKEAIKTAIAQYNSEEIIVKRSEVSASCLQKISEKTSKYGIVIEDVNLTDFSFSEEYTNAIERKQVAEQELERARLESEKKLVEANAAKEANDLLNKTLTNEVLTQNFIDKWDGHLPETYAGGDIRSIFSIN